jgi:acyl-CoA reductase-like NAD-dependent aldehyde dehydrogenase
MRPRREESIVKFGEIADLIERNRDRVVDSLTAVETHKTAVIEVEKSVRALRTYSDELIALEGRSPLGTIAVFLPFNTPLYSTILYAFGPLLAGNRVLVRPSSLTASVVKRLWELLEPGLSDLTLELVGESGRDYVDRVLHVEPADAVIFTGNWESVERLLPEVSNSIKLIYCGGGLCPFAVLDDADLGAAVEAAIYSKTFNSGQDCLATERFYVAAQVFQPFAELLVMKTSHLNVGALNDPTTDIGPLVCREFASSVHRLLREGHDIVKMLYGGQVHRSVVPPTVLEASHAARIVHAEKFAPVFPLVRYDGVDNLMEQMNHPHYCMGATVFGKDLTCIEGRLAAPHVAYNENLLSVEEADAHQPFGGYNRSGFIAYRGMRRGGPILFSVETSSSPINDGCQ